MANETDMTEKSIPKDGKYDFHGRNVLIKRVPLGQRLRLARIFSAGLAAVVKNQPDASNINITKLLENGPDILGMIENHWKDIAKIGTDLTVEELDRSGEIEDIFAICKEVFEVNGFMETMQNLGKEISGIQLGSKSKSHILEESVAGPSKTS